MSGGCEPARRDAAERDRCGALTEPRRGTPSPSVGPAPWRFRPHRKGCVHPPSGATARVPGPDGTILRAQQRGRRRSPCRRTGPGITPDPPQLDAITAGHSRGPCALMLIGASLLVSQVEQASPQALPGRPDTSRLTAGASPGSAAGVQPEADNSPCRLSGWRRRGHGFHRPSTRPPASDGTASRAAVLWSFPCPFIPCAGRPARSCASMTAAPRWRSGRRIR